jgi:replication-associated recombination protein RarA
MNQAASPATRPLLTWKELVEAAIVESDPNNLSQRIQDAQNAIMDEIEDTFQTASPGDCRALINAMNAVRELGRASGRCSIAAQEMGKPRRDKISAVDNWYCDYGK